MNILKNIQLKPNKTRILNAMDCYVDSPIYHEVSHSYVEVLPQVMEAIEPAIAYQHIESNQVKLGNPFDDCSSLVFAVVTLGHKASELSTEAMTKDRYLEGFIIDSILDDLTFSLVNKAYELIKDEVRKTDLQLTKPLYPGDGEIPLESQEILLGVVDPDHQLRMSVTKGYMLNPAKSLSFMCGVSQNIIPLDENIGHNCSKCKSSTNCKWKDSSIELTVISVEKKKYQISVCWQRNLLDILVENRLQIPSPCGGNGTCGKCVIRVIEGKLTPSEKDKASFSQDQLSKGYRLACHAFVEENCRIELLHHHKKMDILEDYDQEIIKAQTIKDTGQGGDSEPNLGIAIDIGTTTVAMQLINRWTGEIVKSYSCLNSQVRFGADVITRIQKANNGYLEELSELIKDDLLKGIKELIVNVGNNNIKNIAIVGNTTMFHLLLGLSCETLGIYPFKPVTIELMEYNFQRLFGSDLLHCQISLLPAISAFVGSDIVAGAYYSNLTRNDEINLFVDIGTNGEMVIGNSARLIASATAAGPAFEGGNISCGVGSIPGAIKEINYTHPYFNYQTINDLTPIGICGSGVLDLVAEGLKHQWIDPTGALKSPFDSGIVHVIGDTITISQQDIREIQLAKAAIRAGIECLIKEYRCTYEDIQHVYLSGGFGTHLRIDSAIIIGLLPKEFKNKVKSIGNSALGGAVKYLLDHKSKEEIMKIVSQTRSIVLSDVHEFNEAYMEQMLFTAEY